MIYDNSNSDSVLLSSSARVVLQLGDAKTEASPRKRGPVDELAY